MSNSTQLRQMVFEHVSIILLFSRWSANKIKIIKIIAILAESFQTTMSLFFWQYNEAKCPLHTHACIISYYANT